MQPQQPHFPQQNNPAQDEEPTIVSPRAHGLPPLPSLDDAATTLSPPLRPNRFTRPPVRRAAQPTIPIQPPTLPGLEDEVRSADAEVRSAVRSMALAPSEGYGALAPTRDDHESSTLLIRGSAKPPHPAGRIVPRRNGPRSFLMQFMVAMITTVVLVSTVTLTTPLGRGMVAATDGQFIASSGIFLFAPSPTASPKPKPSYTYPSKGVNPGTQAIINEINTIFGSYAPGALNIAKCESGYDPNAVNSYPIGNSHASGVFQILYPSTWNTTSYASYSPFDYDKNIRAAYEIFHRDGNSWREWACKPY